MHLTEVSLETLLHLRCILFASNSVCDFDSTANKQIHNENELPGEASAL